VDDWEVSDTETALALLLTIHLQPPASDRRAQQGCLQGLRPCELPYDGVSDHDNLFVLELTHSLRTSTHAAAFGARGTPSVMRLHEIMGIEANRSWGVCSLNDFRKFLGLKSK